MQVIISRLSNFLSFIQKNKKFHPQKYSSTENFDLSFYAKSEKEIWNQIENITGKQNTAQIKKDIDAQKSIFVPQWHQTEKNLLFWKSYFEVNNPSLQKIIAKIKILSGIKKFDIKKIPVYLISDPVSKDKEIDAWFSWTPEKSFIIIEIPLNSKPPRDLFSISVLAHEFFHLMLRKNKKLYSEVNRIAQENRRIIAKFSNHMPNRIFFEELLISSFIPEGYLNEKYFNKKVAAFHSKPKGLLAWRKFVAFKLFQHSREIVDNNQKIDKKYLLSIIKTLK